MGTKYRVEFSTHGEQWGPADGITINTHATFAEAVANIENRLKRYTSLRRDRYRVVCEASGAVTTDGRCPDDLAQHPGANPKQAYGDAKVPLHLVPAALLDSAARALSEGRDKYGAWNWRDSKVEAMTYVGAMLRHLMAYVDGEDQDPDSLTGKSHLDGVAASLAILLDATHGGFLVDNRPPKGPGGALVRKAVKRVPKETK